MRVILIGVAIPVVLAMPAPAAAQTARSYKILATARTSTMEKEMQQAGAAAFRFWPSWAAKRPRAAKKWSF